MQMKTSTVTGLPTTKY